MRFSFFVLIAQFAAVTSLAAEPPLVVKPDAFPTLVNPACSHCRDEAARRAADLKPTDRVLCWTRGYSDGGAVPFRFFLNHYRVISDSYGVFVSDPDAGFARGFAPSYEFTFHGWRNGVVVLKHKDGTLFSGLTGDAFAGPRKGTRLTPIPTVESEWGFWLEHYPIAVAYRMFDKYQPVELPSREEPDSAKTRAPADPRLKADEQVLGVRSGNVARAYLIASLAKARMIADTVDGGPLVVLWEPKTRTAAAYRPIASQPRKYKGPEPDATGVSKPDSGVPVPPGAPVVAPRKLTLGASAGRVQDAETKSTWDIAGRCVDGELKGWTLEWMDGVQVKWFAWAAEHPTTTVYEAPKAPVDANAKVKAIAGTAEFLRLLPKPFATVTTVDPAGRKLYFLKDGETTPSGWSLEPDAEVKIGGWWGRLEQINVGDRVWVWLKLDRKKNPVSIAMVADDVSEFDMHGSLRKKSGEAPKFTPEQIEAKRSRQKDWLRKQWIDNGLPGTVASHHGFSGELEIVLDHEAMRWGRSLTAGDTVSLNAVPPIKGVVKSVTAWHERTRVVLIVGELESSELKPGQRLNLKMTPPAAAVESSNYPPDIDRLRSRAERVEWFLSSIYCTCGVSKDVCTGHFYTLASCNPNGCAMPNHMRERIGEMIDQGKTDRQIFDQLRKEGGPLLLRPHLMP